MKYFIKAAEVVETYKVGSIEAGTNFGIIDVTFNFFQPVGEEFVYSLNFSKPKNSGYYILRYV